MLKKLRDRKVGITLHEIFFNLISSASAIFFLFHLFNIGITLNINFISNVFLIMFDRYIVLIHVYCKG